MSDRVAQPYQHQRQQSDLPADLGRNHRVGDPSSGGSQFVLYGLNAAMVGSLT